MEIEHVARIGFTARRTTKQQRHLTIGNGLLGKVVVHDDGVHAVVAEEFAHRSAGVGCEVLQRSRFRSGCGHDDGVFHRAVFFELLHDLCNGRTLLADGDVDAVKLLAFIVGLIGFLLVDEGVDRDSRFTGLTVADDQFALATANRDEGVDGLEARLHRLADRFTRDDARSLLFDQTTLGRFDRTLAIDRIAQSIDHAAKKGLADGNVHDGVGALYAVAFADFLVGAEDNRTDVVGFEVERHALNAIGEFDHFAGLHVIEAVDAGNTVTHRQHGTDFADFGFSTEIGDLVLDDLRDFCGADIHDVCPLSLHGLGKRIETGADRGIEALRTDGDDEAAQQIGVDVRGKFYGAAFAGRQLGFQIGELRIAERMRAGHFCRDFPALCGGDGAECANYLRKLRQAAVLCQHAKEVLCQLGNAQKGGHAPQGLLRIGTRHLGVGRDGSELGRFAERGLDLVEVRFDRCHGPVFAGEVEQGRSVTPCQASLNTGGNIHALEVLSGPEEKSVRAEPFAGRQESPRQGRRAPSKAPRQWQADSGPGIWTPLLKSVNYVAQRNQSHGREAMETVPLAPKCGVEITGVNLASVDGRELDSIKQAIFTHGVALFRGQDDFTPDAHIAFARRWGGIDINNYFPLTDDHPEIAVVRKRADQVTNIGGGWHTDHSYDQIPAMGSILVARTLPPSGGDTLWAHMGEAYDALSDELKQEIEGLEAFHTADHIYEEGGLYAQTDIGSDLRGQGLKTGATHPIVIRHPQTGRKLLYVNSAFTINIVGRTRQESLPLLQRLYDAATQADNVCRVAWEAGSVAIWDNRTTWHFASNDYQGHAREMHRITLTGEPLAA